MHTGWDIVEVAQARGRSPLDAAAVYWGLFDGLDVAWLWERVGKLPRSDRWQSHARAAQRDDLMATLRDLTDDALRSGDVFTPCEDLVAGVAGRQRADRPAGARRLHGDPHRQRLRPDHALGRPAAAAQRRAGGLRGPLTG